MSIGGLLGVTDTERAFINTVGQRLVYDAAQEYIRAHNADVDAFMRIFVERTTEEHTVRYKLPGSGRLQRRGGQAQSAAVKPHGGWDVSFPLEDFGAQLAYDSVQAAYMTIAQLQNHVDTIRVQDLNTARFEMMRALFNNSARTFEDEHLQTPTLNLQPLANGDSVLYPPLIGAENAATSDHYLVSGYTASSISDNNNPYYTIRDKLEKHFGKPTGFGRVTVWINSAEVPKTEGLTDFDPVNDRFVQPGADTDTVIGLPSGMGRVIGRVSGVFVVEYDWIPSGYMLAVDLDMPAPLVKRVDPADTGLPRGLTLVGESDEHPFDRAHWRNRYGVAVGNRLNGVVMQFKASGTYDTPSAYV